MSKFYFTETQIVLDCGHVWWIDADTIRIAKRDGQPLWCSECKRRAYVAHTEGTRQREI